jgi:uncharacterized membrane protein YobD (UPF0266 family)
MSKFIILSFFIYVFFLRLTRIVLCLKCLISKSIIAEYPKLREELNEKDNQILLLQKENLKLLRDLNKLRSQQNNNNNNSNNNNNNTSSTKKNKKRQKSSE